MDTPKPRKKTDGARLLRAYLDGIKQSVPKFCDEHGLDRIMVQRAMNGERLRFSVDFAKAIQTATSGAVAWDSWESATAVEVEPPGKTGTDGR